MPPIDPTNHPGDYIDHAQTMIRFLAMVLGDQPGQMELPAREREGLCHILYYIEANLNQALTRL